VLLTSKKKYVVLRPFSALDAAGNHMTIHSNEVVAEKPSSVWVKGVVGHQKFRVLSSIFIAATALKD
jgi:hypothetical protein